ncbi:MAG: hypothetical protein LBG60_11615 [Bifidobacteriaceae bacterium]|nr:hypothetical protein [Bifidobacteriaceae bacterium]
MESGTFDHDSAPEPLERTAGGLGAGDGARLLAEADAGALAVRRALAPPRWFLTSIWAVCGAMSAVFAVEDPLARSLALVALCFVEGVVVGVRSRRTRGLRQRWDRSAVAAVALVCAVLVPGAIVAATVAAGTLWPVAVGLAEFTIGMAWTAWFHRRRTRPGGQSL